MYDKFFLALLDTSSAHAEISRAKFHELGLTAGQPKILYILNNRDGYVQKELADICGIKPSTLTVLLNKLEGKNLIKKEKVTLYSNKHAHRIYLTNTGKQIAKKIENIIEIMEENSFSGFSEEERKNLLSMLCRVADNLKHSADC